VEPDPRVGRKSSARRWARVAFRTAVLAGLAGCIWLVSKQAVAAWCYRQKQPDEIETAMEWDPGNPEYPNALGKMMHSYMDSSEPAEIVHLEERAARLSASDAWYWADLGAADEWAGHSEEAKKALERARELFPKSPEIEWRLANFYVREGDAPQGLEALRAVLRSGGIPHEQVFALGTGAAGDAERVMEAVLPRDGSMDFEYLNYLASRGNAAEAKKAWAYALQTKASFQIRDAFPYLDMLIRENDGEAVAQAWTEMERRFPGQMGAVVEETNLLFNGSFKRKPLGGGLDWRIYPQEGATVEVEEARVAGTPGAAKIVFDGEHNVDYGGVMQYVEVQPDTRYRCRVRMRTAGITSDSGPRMQIYDAKAPEKMFVRTEGLVGDLDWSEQEVQFKTTPETRLVVVRIARPASQRLDNKIGGTVWVTGAELNARP
jgi:tetratricopeptide (TPR) repeat protein